MSDNKEQSGAKAPAYGRGPMGGGPRHGMSMPVEKPKDFKATMKKLLAYCKNYISAILVALVAAAGGTLLQIIGPDRLKTLTNEIMKGTFALKVDEYKQVKALARENLRDHMTDIELILTMLGEATTTKLHRDRDSVGMPKLKKDAKDGGAVAGRTRKDIEQQSGKPVISPGNFKQLAAKPVSRVKKIKGSEG